MAKLIIRHVFHNFERTKERMLGISSRIFISLVLLEYWHVLEELGKSELMQLLRKPWLGLASSCEWLLLL